ncbi:DUF1592 domain-containing protein [bacterium]|nr:DUF1592 domain-containing protein [bacterium]
MRAGLLYMLLLVVLAPVAGAEPVPARLNETQRGFFRDYCVECHNAETQEGMLRLDEIPFVIESVEQADRWQKILNQLNSGAMPPENATQPEPARKADFLDVLSHTLVTARKTLGDQGGRITLRRLNQREYRNTIRALLGVDVETSDLPADSGTGTFDTVGASQYMSGDQIEQYLALSRRALDESSARAAGGTQHHRAREEAEDFGNRRMDSLFKRTRELHEQHASWAAAVDAAAERPENLDIAAVLREKAKKPRPSSGVPYPTPLFFYYDWDQIKGAPPPTEFGFNDAQAAFFSENQYLHFFPYYDDYQKLPGRESGAWLLFYQAYREAYVSAGEDWPPGTYTLRMRVAANEAAPPERRFLEVGQRGDDVSDFTVFGAHQVTGTLDDPQIIERVVQISTDGKREFAIREKRPNSRTAEIRSYHDEFEKTGHGPVPAIWIDWLEIDGPGDAPSGIVSLTADSQGRAGARDVIERFATRAFRGVKPEPEYLDRLVALFESRLDVGDDFDDALKTPLSVVLASPGFLYLSEPSGNGGPRKLDGFELASRLSYFLWSAPPDDELLALAGSEELLEPDVLAAQVDRMLDDGRSHEFVAGFAHQWLGLERLDFFQFDFRLHRSFDDSTKAAAREEVYQTIALLLRENLSLSRLLKSDFAVINGLLASYYGIDGVTGDEFRRIDLPDHSPRGGLLGMAAILAMGSNGQVTSPVERGAWVLRKLLNDPPPPAPPNVPQLARLDGQLLNVRERLRAHQEQPQCANCHRRIDPLGLGLENFDAAGKWRTEDTLVRDGSVRKTWPIKPAGAFFNGPEFNSYLELRDIIASRPDGFARGFSESLIEYALGRPCGFTDADLTAAMIQRARSKDFAVREFIQALVASSAFRSK